MQLVERFVTAISYVVSFLTASPLSGPALQQQDPLLIPSNGGHEASFKGPIFKPPGGRPSGPGSDFQCDYSNMPGFVSCSTPENRSCWLRNEKTGFEYNVRTNYEQLTPVGVHRTYYLNLTDTSVNADGLDSPHGKLFNSTYPGPWIQACWGDNVTVIVHNKLKHNGTSIHWHGIRQWLTMHMDGVNGVTQCPIAPGDSFNYTWRAMQYGSSWYHSHYSVQYADGAVGPMTLHGPTSEPFDEPKLPILMTDWGYNSAFNASFVGLTDKSILLNGIGNVTRYNNSVKAIPGTIPNPYTVTFERPSRGARAKRYLLRLINTSFDSTFVFSIDGHMLQIVGADFVPIHSYMNTSVLVGIGQRYHVIVSALENPTEEAYTIRTYKANCFRFNQALASPGYEKTGTLRYSDKTVTPNSKPWPLGSSVSLDCSDETYSSLKPILPWQVGRAGNDPLGGVGENFTLQFGRGSSIYPLALFSMGGDNFNPLRIDYGDSTFNHLNNSGAWNPLWVVIPETYKDKDWVYLALQGVKITGRTSGAHTIHLHGHDFAILQQIGGATFPSKLNLTLNNPPRRDIVLLPQDGYVVIAFKTDNPGAWLVHCHIADHASAGLAMQIMERREDAADIWPTLEKSQALRNAKRTCDAWNRWVGICTNWWPGDGSTCPAGELGFAPDSGI